MHCSKVYAYSITASTRASVLSRVIVFSCNARRSIHWSRGARGGSHPWLSLSALRYLRLTYAGRYNARQKDEI
jgi:hypothetical protein